MSSIPFWMLLGMELLTNWPGMHIINHLIPDVWILT